MVEYALLLSLVALALVGTIGGMAGQVGGRFNAISNTLASSGNGGSSGGSPTTPGGGTGPTTSPSSPQTPPANTEDSKWDGDHDDLSLMSYAVLTSSEPSGGASNYALEFYRDDPADLPLPGEKSRGSGWNISAVYKDAERIDAANTKSIPWNGYKFLLKSITFYDRTQPTSIAYWFSDINSSGTVQFDVSKLDLSKCINAKNAFKDIWDNARALRVNIKGLGELDTSHIRNASYMFSACALDQATLDQISKLDFSSCRYYTAMFDGISAALDNGTGSSRFSLDLTSWDTSKAVEMAYMFSNNKGLEKLDGISAWDTSNVTSMEAMFYGTPMSSISKLDLSGWDVNKVTNHDHFETYSDGGNQMLDNPYIVAPNFK